MEDNNQNPLTLEGLANAYQQIKGQFNNAKFQVTGLHNELIAAQNELTTTRNSPLAALSSSSLGLEPKKPETFTGRGSIHSWITHISNYLGDEKNPKAFIVDISYPSGTAHEW